MKKIFLLTILLMACFSSFAQSLEWAKSMGGTGDDQGYSIAVDAAGNVFTIGRFNGTADFDPGTGTFNLTSAGSEDIFISKLDAAGNFVWAKRIGGTSNDYGNSIAVDNAGNVLITGYFQGTINFNGTFNLTSGSSDTDIFISKLDAVGNFIWVKRIGGSSVYVDKIFNNSISVDAAGNVFSTGWFDGTVDYDPGPGTFNLNSAGNFAVFILKLDEAGNFVWAKAMGAPNGVSGGGTHGKGIAVDNSGNVFTIGYFSDTVDFDPGPGTFDLIPTLVGNPDVFISKLDSVGNFVWAKSIGGTNSVYGNSIAIDSVGNIFTTGIFYGITDFDPGLGTYHLTSAGLNDIFISKLDTAGNFVWARRMGEANSDYAESIAVDSAGNVFTTGRFQGSADFDPGLGYFNLTSDSTDIFISKLDASGNFVWAKRMGGTNYDSGKSIALDALGNVFMTGLFESKSDFDPDLGTFDLTAASWDIFIVKLGKITAGGYIFNDLNVNCSKDSLENSIGSHSLIIQPGNIIVQAQNGYWTMDSLSPGTYIATVDTSGQWKSTCSPSVSFTVVHPDSFVQVTPIGMKNFNSCTEPEITIMAPSLRRCFSNQFIYIEAKNHSTAFQVMYNSFADVTLNPFLSVTSASRPYTSLGNNTYRFQLDSLYPGQSKTWTIKTSVTCSSTIGQTLCMDAKIFPVSPCVLDSTPTPPGLGTVSPCTGTWDNSSLAVKGTCIADSVRFVITNTGVFGNGDMDCFMPIRIYANGVLISLDSLKIVGGDSLVIMIPADGRTWRLEADQHPLHPGNSHPNATVDACGDSSQLAQNWTPGTVNTMPLDDADPVIDIYCGVVRGSYDPNDKTGYPTGVTNNHYILKNQQLQYVIRFQNTGTDTAFTVVIRDTLETDLNIFSVKTGVSSHNYSFRMYGPRVLEWTFNNIMLPDSFHSEPNSHGFVTFTVEQVENLPNGTLIENSAAIYFDFNDPVITNSSQHEINEEHFLTPVSVDKLVQQSDIQVYPNPTEDKLHVVSSLPSSIKLLDLTGRLLKNMPAKQKSHELNLSEFPAGIYLLEVEVNGKIEVKKVIRR